MGQHCRKFRPVAMTRRDMLGQAGLGFGASALVALMNDRSFAGVDSTGRDRSTSLNPLQPRKPHFQPQAKNIIFLYMDGGVSHVDSFDPKAALEKYNVLICPTAALPAVPADHDSTKEPVIINGVEVDPMIGWVMTYPFNIMSRCPVMSVPSGHASNGVPTGLQIVGPMHGDSFILSVARALEGVFTGDARLARPLPDLEKLRAK